MAFLFQKFQKAVSALAKSSTFAKDPRQLQFEADVNKLFLYTGLLSLIFFHFGLFYVTSSTCKNVFQFDAPQFVSIDIWFHIFLS